jgi:ABC-2 type transport system ATP-binding protein
MEYPIIQIHNLKKTYSNALEPSLDGVSLDVKKGEVYGLLGPNGAGKTTLISILCGVVSPSEGEMLYNGFPIIENLAQLKQEIGVVPQDIALYPSLTAKENLQFYGAMYGIHGTELQSKINFWLEKFELSHAANRRIDKFSGGMKRRVNLIASIMHEPKLLFLDEPTVGVDVQSRTKIMEQLVELNKNGMTIIYTSHHLAEAEDFCNTIGIIDAGKIIATDSPKSLIEQTSNARDLEDVFLALTNRKLRD